MNVVNFPICQSVSGRYWYGGRAFDTVQEVIDSIPDREWRRVVQWADRHAARFESGQVRFPSPPCATDGAA
jgi:hypothetical protein